MTAEGAVERLLSGAIDCHVHAAPDPLRKRPFHVLNLANQAKELGMRAFVFKCHHYCTTMVCEVVNRLVPDFQVIGSIVLNREVGGLNPEIVEAAVEGGAKYVWMPTQSSIVDSQRRKEGKARTHQRQTRFPDEGISLLDSAGKLVPQIDPILDIIKISNVVLATGHISIPEIYAVTAEARRRQIKVIITHPMCEVAGSRLNLAQQQDLKQMGAYLEYCFNHCMPALDRQDPVAIVQTIKAVGAEHCILSTDFGQDYNPVPGDGFRMMLANMLKAGLSEAEAKIMVQDNPARLLGLD